MTHEQLYAVLFRTVKPGAALGDPFPSTGRKQLLGIGLMTTISSNFQR